MTNQFILDKIQEATEYLNKTNQIGEAGFDMCDGILSNLKAMIHDETIWKKVNEKEEKVFKEFNKKKDEAKTKLKDIDPLIQWQTGAGFYNELRHWKSKEMLSFWDKLSKEYDL